MLLNDEFFAIEIFHSSRFYQFKRNRKYKGKSIGQATNIGDEAR